MDSINQRGIFVFAMALMLSVSAQAANQQHPSQMSALPAAAQVSISSALAREAPEYFNPLPQLAELTTTDSVAGFGYSVATSGDTIVVGSYVAGAAYVFVKPTGGWANTTTPTARLTAPDNVSPHFGAAVGISGHTIVVSAPYDFNSGVGVAYVYEEPAGGWTDMTETARLTASNKIDMGWVLAIDHDGNTIVVAAGGATVKGAYASGRVFVYTKPASGWRDMTETAQLTEPNEFKYSNFGGGVAVRGRTIVVCEQGYNSSQGALFVYVRKGRKWWSTHKYAAMLTASDGVAGDQFGAPSVVITDHTIATGAWQHPFSISNGAGPGAAYVFVEPAGGWMNMTETAELTASDTGVGYFGNNVALGGAGNMLLVGADFTTIDSNPYQGAAYVYHKPSSGWASTSQFATKLVASDGVAMGTFGAALANSSGAMAITAPGDSVPGTVYVFGP